jgi:galactose mutarotase-like enzyme
MKHLAWLLACLICPALVLAAPRYEVTMDLAAGPGSPAIVVLHDHQAQVEAAVAPSEGGELTSVRVQHQGQWVEMIYRARDYAAQEGFRGKASTLFPAVGGQYLPGTTPKTSCEDGEYAVGGKTYSIPCHGFARNFPWELVSSSADKKGARVTVRLRDSEKTRAAYPFGFALTATYTLQNGSVSIAYQLAASAKNTRPMVYSIGNHVGFRVPFLAGTEPGAVTLETPSTKIMLRDSHGLISGEQGARSFATPMRLDQFNSTVALALTGYQGSSNTFATLRDPGGLSIRVSHHTSKWLDEPLVRFNIYGGPKQGYLCPEPWVGLQNSLNRGAGRMTLGPGDIWKWEILLEPGK